MKYKILSYLLAASTMFSLQAVIIINDTSFDIKLDSLRYSHPIVDVPSEEIEHGHAPVVIPLKPSQSLNTKDLDIILKAMRVTINGLVDKFDNLTDDTTIKFVEDEKGIKYIRS